MTVPPRVGSSSGISVKSGFRWTWGTLGVEQALKPLMNPKTSTRRWLARTTAPWIVALSAGVSPPAVRMPMRFIAKCTPLVPAGPSTWASSPPSRLNDRTAAPRTMVEHRRDLMHHGERGHASACLAPQAELGEDADQHHDRQRDRGRLPTGPRAHR